MGERKERSPSDAKAEQKENGIILGTWPGEELGGVRGKKGRKKYVR